MRSPAKVSGVRPLTPPPSSEHTTGTGSPSQRSAAATSLANGASAIRRSPRSIVDPTKAAPKPVYAEVESGDTLDQIAIDNNTTVERILTLNPGLDPTGLQVGQQVRVR